MKNYYQILNLDINASKEEVKKAYRLYASKFHPDKQNNDKFFEERFKEVKEAYDILTDDAKRAKYDLSNKNTYYKEDDLNHTFDNKSAWYDRTKSKKSTKTHRTHQTQEFNEEKNQSSKKQKNIFYSSRKILINETYINLNGKIFYLSKYDLATIRKNDESKTWVIGIFLIIFGIFTISFFIGGIFIIYGIALCFVKTYFLVLTSINGDDILLEGSKSKMNKLVKIINKAINS